MGQRGEIFQSSLCQKVAPGVVKEGERKEQILDPINVNFPSYKKWVLKRISACGFLHSVLYFHSEPYARAQVPAVTKTLPI